MMISAVRIRSKTTFAIAASKPGMTLLEVVIAMSLIAVLSGLGMVKYANGADERTLRETVARVEAMASRGHAMAILHQKPFWLRLEEGKLILAGADLESRDVSADEDDYSFDRRRDDERENVRHEIIYDTLTTEALVGLRRWGAKETAWQFPEEKEVITWSFQSSGLCEPVAFRIELGESWVVMHMHPLTARIEEEEMEIK